MIPWRDRKTAGLAAFDAAVAGKMPLDPGIAAFRAAVKGEAPLDPGIAAFYAAVKGEDPGIAAFHAAKNASVKIEMTEANQPPGKIGTPKEESAKFVQEHPELYGGFREATPVEERKSGFAAAVAGAGEGMAAAITMPIDVSIDQATLGGLRRGFGAAKKFLSGERVRPEDIQPPMPLTSLASSAASDAQNTFRKWLDVPEGAITDVPDAIIRTTSMLLAGGKAAKGIGGLLARGSPEMNAVVAKATAPNATSVPSEPWALPARDSSEFAQAVRIIPVGERDLHMAEANQLRDAVSRIVPKATDQEAMTLMRDFKGDPAGLERFLNGNHEAYAGMDAGAKAEAMARVEHLRPIIERAMNPTPEMQQADALLDEYFKKTLEEGRNAGTLDSNVDPNEYITHLLQPKDPRAVKSTGAGLRYTKWSRNTPFSKHRAYPTVLHAVADGVEPRTLNAFDALAIYGERHGTAIGMRTLVNTLKESDLAKFGSGPGGKNIPSDWVEVGAGTRIFRSEVPFTDAEGEAQVAHQALYAPPDIAKAIEPLTDPDWTDRIPGFRNTRMYQAYIKSAELSLSVFHMSALNVTALGNMGFEGLLRSYGSDMKSATFLDVEKTFVRHGGTTSIAGRALEAYRAARVTSLPTRLDVIRNLPVLRQFDRAGEATSRLTFNILQRKFKVTDFAIKDAKWIAEHPTASPTQLASARRSIAKEINAAYGGLNWEVLGVSKANQSLLRGIFLAPDWTFSNWLNLKTAFAGGPGGGAARAFWLRSSIVGVGATKLATRLFSGKWSNGSELQDWTQVYMGKDSKGKDVYQNMFFAGAPSDLVNLIGNSMDFDPVGGLVRTIANKLSPFLRTAGQQVENTDFMGRPIRIRGANILTNLKRGAKHAASQVLPVPFSASNIEQMLTDPKNEYSMEEYITTLIRGTRPRHVPPASAREMQRRRAEARAQK